LTGDGFLDDRDGVGRRQEVTGDGGVEHGEIIQVVAGGEHLSGGDTQVPGDGGEGGALRVGGVTEARVDVVPDKGKVGDCPAVSPDVGLDAVRLRVGIGQETERRPGVPVDLGGVVGFDPGGQTRDVGLHPGEEGGVIAGAAFVPVAERDIAGGGVLVDLPFDGDDVIGPDGQACPGDDLHEPGEIAAGVDDPWDAGVLELAQQFLQSQRHRRVLELGENCPIKIGRNQAQPHRDPPHLRARENRVIG